MLSIIVPFNNEKENLPILYEKLVGELKRLAREYEIIFVDDGSTDGSSTKLKFQSSNFKVLILRKRFGKGKALATGFKESKGEIIIFMDADLQDDPSDIGKFLTKIDEGYELVNGWRKNRLDGLNKTIPSTILNKLILKLLFNTKFHDVNCGFKAIKRYILEDITFYGDNYRFIPLIAEKNGYKVTEIEVSHQKRLHGKSKYNFVRLFFGFFDTLTTYFIYRFSEAPLHFFGLIGGNLFLVGFLISLYLSYERLFRGVLLYRRPALLLAILLIIVGIQIIMTGIVAELMVYLNKKKK